MNVQRVGRLSFAGFFVLVFAYVIWEARFGYGVDFPRTTWFPLAIGIPSLGLALLALALEVRGTRGLGVRADAIEPIPGEEDIPPEVARRRTLEMMGWVLAFFLGIWLLGFSVAVPVLTFVYLKAGAREGWLPSLGLAAAAYAFFYGLFDYGLHVPFPPGLVFEIVTGLTGGS
jgi:hypothetical protein